MHWHRHDNPRRCKSISSARSEDCVYMSIMEVLIFNLGCFTFACKKFVSLLRYPNNTLLLQSAASPPPPPCSLVPHCDTEGHENGVNPWQLQWGLAQREKLGGSGRKATPYSSLNSCSSSSIHTRTRYWVWSSFRTKPENKERGYCFQQRDPWVTLLIDPSATPHRGRREENAQYHSAGVECALQ